MSLAEDLFPISNSDPPHTRYNQWGYIDRESRLAIPPQFHRGFSFSEGIALVVLRNGETRFIDPRGRELFSFDLKGDLSAMVFSEGLVVVSLRETGHAIVDREGNVVAEGIPAHRTPRAFAWGRSLFEVPPEPSLDLWGYLGPDGAVAIEPRFSKAHSFTEGLAAVQDASDKNWGYIDPKGAWVIDPQFSSAEPFSGGVAFVSEGLIEPSGEMVLLKEDFAAWPDRGFCTGLARFSSGSKMGYVNTQGEIAIEAQFDRAADFSEGLAAVRVDRRMGYIDPEGSWVVEPDRYRICESFKNGLAKVTIIKDPHRDKHYDQCFYAYIDHKGGEVYNWSAWVKKGLPL
jgi:hypothetical protein